MGKKIRKIWFWKEIEDKRRIRRIRKRNRHHLDSVAIATHLLFVFLLFLFIDYIKETPNGNPTIFGTNLWIIKLSSFLLIFSIIFGVL